MFGWVFEHFYGANRLREKALKLAESEVSRAYLEQAFPEKTVPLADIDIVAVDLETTGLDAKVDKILSIGMVDICSGAINLSTATHQYLTVKNALPESSVIIHQITDDVVANGLSIEQVMPMILERLAGKVMLVHYSPVEMGFLDMACRKLYGSPFIIPVIDTLKLGQRAMEMRNHTIQSSSLRLFNLRPRYNLPPYKAHSALMDAVATAELFLAMSQDMVPKGNATLGDFVTG